MPPKRIHHEGRAGHLLKTKLTALSILHTHSSYIYTHTHPSLLPPTTLSILLHNVIHVQITRPVPDVPLRPLRRRAFRPVAAEGAAAAVKEPEEAEGAGQRGGAGFVLPFAVVVGLVEVVGGGVGSGALLCLLLVPSCMVVM